MPIWRIRIHTIRVVCRETHYARETERVFKAACGYELHKGYVDQITNNFGTDRRPENGGLKMRKVNAVFFSQKNQRGYAKRYGRVDCLGDESTA